MSTKTTFKRIALVAVAALGLGVLSVAPSAQAAFTVASEVFTIDSATDSILVNDTATAVLTSQFFSSDATDSVTVKAVCTASGGATTCPNATTSTGTSKVSFWTLPTSDTQNVMGILVADQQQPIWLESTTATSAAPAISKSVVNIKTGKLTTAGTYTYTIYTNTNGSTTGKSVTWTVTVAPENTDVTAAVTWMSNSPITGTLLRNQRSAASDSSIVVSSGTAATPVAAAYIYAMSKNSAGDTVTTSGTLVTGALTVTVSGPGLVSTALDASGKAKVATLTTSNANTAGSATETATVFSDGTAGVSTITISNASGTILATKTVTFTGSPASAPSIWLTDTVVSTAGSVNVKGIVKDSAGNVLSSGTVYMYSSDTSVAGSMNLTQPTAGQTAHRCTVASNVATCAVTVTDSGVATLTLRDSWTVAASTWTSAGVALTVTGTKASTVTAAFNKATYAPGEKAIITITATDQNSRSLATESLDIFTVIATPSLSYSTIAVEAGTQGASLTTTNLFVGYLDTGVETRVVTMPTYGTAVSYKVTFTATGASATTDVIATATVVDPTATAVAAAKDAADAATDAALEATDAAYSATDAANIAAEAADAATAAAEAATEAANAAKESADAATAAVEELATSVAKLMAALQAQITTLAKVVAKIAVKVKA